MTYQPKQFDLPAFTGLSEKQIKVHLALYEGYVKHANLLMETLKGYAAYGDKTSDGDKFAITELRRRFAFEFNGMRMHEYYFEQFEGGATAMNQNSSFASAAAEKYGSGENFLVHIKEVTSARGIGWVVVYYDVTGKMLHTVFVNDHEIGQLAGLPIILALDMWEHAFMVDYMPTDKKNYVDAFFANVNWNVVEERFDKEVA